MHALNPETGERAIVDLQPGDLIRIAPGIAHAGCPRLRHGGRVRTEPFDPMDTQPFPVVSKEVTWSGAKLPHSLDDMREQSSSHPATNARVHSGSGAARTSRSGVRKWNVRSLADVTKYRKRRGSRELRVNSESVLRFRFRGTSQTFVVIPALVSAA